MRKFMLMLAAMLVSSTIAAQVTMDKQGFLKTSVAEFTEPDRTKFLAFLADCRKVSDSAMKAITENDAAAATKMATPAAAKQWTEAAAAFKALRADSPAATLQYRNQALELVGKDETPTSRVWYALSTGPEVSKNFLGIVVESGLGGKAGRVISVEAFAYQGEIPSWLKRVDARVEPPK